MLDHFETWEQFNTLYHQLLWTRLVIDAVLNIYIVILFCRRILNLTKRRLSQCPVPSQNGRASSFNNRQSEKIYGVMIKYFLLTTWTVLSTQIFTVTQLVLSDSIQHAVSNGQFEYYYTAYALYYVAGNVDAVISTAFVVLSYSFSDRIYERFCGCAHDKCLWIWGNARLPKPIKSNMSSMSSLSRINKNSTQNRSLAVMPSKTMSLTLGSSVSTTDCVGRNVSTTELTQSEDEGGDTVNEGDGDGQKRNGL